LSNGRNEKGGHNSGMFVPGGLENLSKKMPIFCGYFRINSLAAKRCFISIIDGCFEKINAGLGHRAKI